MAWAITMTVTFTGKNKWRIESNEDRIEQKTCLLARIEEEIIRTDQ